MITHSMMTSIKKHVLEMHSREETAQLSLSWYPLLGAGREQMMLCLQQHPMGPVNHAEIIKPRESNVLTANYSHC